MISGDVLWCMTCGSYADSKTKSLKNGCNGPPPRELHGGGMRGQLNKLLSSMHPKTGRPLPLPTNIDGSPVEGSRTYMRLERLSAPSCEAPVVDPGFKVYVPAETRKMVPSAGKSASEKRAEMVARVRAKERKLERPMRRLRGKQPQPADFAQRECCQVVA